MVEAKQAEQSTLEHSGRCYVGGLRRKVEGEYRETANGSVPWKARLRFSKDKAPVLSFQVRIVSSVLLVAAITHVKYWP